MKPLSSRISWLLAIILLFSSQLIAQKNEAPQSRFSASVNLLGFLNHDIIGTFEYRVSDGIGIFLGGGKSAAMVELGNFDDIGQGQFLSNGAGIFAGLNISIPLGSITGLSAKPILSYTNAGEVNSDEAPVPAVPQEIVYIQEKIGAYLNIAYSQNISTNFFIEPVLGMGVVFGRNQAPKSRFDTHWLSFPAQLNFGVRF